MDEAIRYLGSAAPVMSRKFIKTSRIIQNILFFAMEDNVVHVVRSKFQIIWTCEELSANKTNLESDEVIRCPISAAPMVSR